MPIGLCSAPTTFQSLMNCIFRDCIDVFVVVYMDDLFISCKDEAFLLENLKIGFSRLKGHKLYVLRKNVNFKGKR